MDPAVIEQLASTFLPHIHKKQVRVAASNARFVHYTDAEAAFKIFESKEFWMRESTCMNDYREVIHGKECLIKAWEGDQDTPFKLILNSLFPNIIDEIVDRFDDWVPLVERDTYMACFSEHKASEDKTGRLSMWRAYGNETPVAIILNNQPFLNNDDLFHGVYSVPVDYTDEEGIKNLLQEIASGIDLNQTLIQGLEREQLIGFIFQVFKFAMICTKHPGFSEEKEWRVSYCPKQEDNDLIKKSIETIGGVPQQVYKIPLKYGSEKDNVGVDASQLIDRIIIGPSSKYSFAMYKAFVDLLYMTGVPDPYEKVIISQIPLRSN